MSFYPTTNVYPLLMANVLQYSINKIAEVGMTTPYVRPLRSGDYGLTTSYGWMAYQEANIGLPSNTETTVLQRIINMPADLSLILYAFTLKPNTTNVVTQATLKLYVNDVLKVVANYGNATNGPHLLLVPAVSSGGYRTIRITITSSNDQTLLYYFFGIIRSNGSEVYVAESTTPAIGSLSTFYGAIDPVLNGGTSTTIWTADRSAKLLVFAGFFAFGQYTLQIRKNGSAVKSITITSSDVGTRAGYAVIQVSSGDVVDLYNPSTSSYRNVQALTYLLMPDTATLINLNNIPHIDPRSFLVVDV